MAPQLTFDLLLWNTFQMILTSDLWKRTLNLTNDVYYNDHQLYSDQTVKEVQDTLNKEGEIISYLSGTSQIYWKVIMKSTKLEPKDKTKDLEKTNVNNKVWFWP